MYLYSIHKKREQPKLPSLLCLVTRSNYLVAALRLLSYNLRLQLYVFFAVRRLDPGNSTFSLTSIYPISAPTTIHSANVYLVEPPGTAPGSCPSLLKFQRYKYIYNTFRGTCQVLFLLQTLLFLLLDELVLAMYQQCMP
jgi:hypothetical protein